jgi:hypothetical protein
MSTRPNITPIVITTGVGPHGPKTLHVQAPDDSQIDPVLLALSQNTTAASTIDNVIPTQPSTPALTQVHVQDMSSVISKRGLKPSPFSLDLIEKVKAKIKSILQKRSLEETILNIGK